MCAETLRTGLIFLRWSIWGVTCLGLLKNEHFPMYLIKNPINVCWNPQNRACFSEMIDLRVTCLGLLEKWTFSHLSPYKSHKCVLKPSEQGSFFQDNPFEGSHAYVYMKNECFPIYLLRNPINVCWNPQNRMIEMIDLRVLMPRFTLKMNISHLSL